MSDKLLNFVSEWQDINWEYTVSILYIDEAEFDYLLNMEYVYDRGENKNLSVDMGPILHHKDEFEEMDVDVYHNEEAPHGVDNEKEIGRHTVEARIKE